MGIGNSRIPKPRKFNSKINFMSNHWILYSSDYNLVSYNCHRVIKESSKKLQGRIFEINSKFPNLNHKFSWDSEFVKPTASFTMQCNWFGITLPALINFVIAFVSCKDFDQFTTCFHEFMRPQLQNLKLRSHKLINISKLT